MNGLVEIEITINDKRCLKQLAEFIKRDGKYFSKMKKITGWKSLFFNDYLVISKKEFEKFKFVFMAGEPDYQCVDNTDYSDAVLQLNNLFNCNSKVTKALLDCSLAYWMNRIMSDLKSSEKPLKFVVGEYYVQS